MRLGSDAIKFAAAGALVALALREETALQIGAHGAVPSLIRMLSYDLVLCQQMGCQVIAELARWERCRVQILNHDGIKAICDAMTSAVNAEANETSPNRRSQRGASPSKLAGASNSRSAASGRSIRSQADAAGLIALREACAVALERFCQLEGNGEAAYTTVPGGGIGLGPKQAAKIDSPPERICAADGVTPLMHELTTGSSRARAAAAAVLLACSGTHRGKKESIPIRAIEPLAAMLRLDQVRALFSFDARAARALRRLIRVNVSRFARAFADPFSRAHSPKRRARPRVYASRGCTTAMLCDRSS